MVVQQINYNMGVAWVVPPCLKCTLPALERVVLVVVVVVISQLADIVRGVWVLFAVLLSAHCTYINVSANRDETVLISGKAKRSNRVIRIVYFNYV